MIHLNRFIYLFIYAQSLFTELQVTLLVPLHDRQSEEEV